MAEKLQAMVMLGMANSRLKDFYDLWTLSRQFPFEGVILSEAIQATFVQRQTEIALPNPTALTAEFAEHPEKARQWLAFLNRNKLDIGDMSLARLIAESSEFLLPPWQAIAQRQLFKATWVPQGPWQIED